MLVCLSYHLGDFAQAKDLLAWIKTLDPSLPQHSLFMMAASTVPMDQVDSLTLLAKSVFGKVESLRIKPTVAIEGGNWPRPANAMFRTAYEQIRKMNVPCFLWLEGDAVPLVPGWLDTLEAEYRKAGKPFFGTIYPHPKRHLNGVMVMPGNIARWNPQMPYAHEVAFDLIGSEINLRLGHNTHLIQRLLADHKLNQACSFPDADSLKQIRKGVILFHGCKDGTILQRLREQREQQPERGTKVHSFYKKTLGRVISRTKKETISIRRTGAIGDAIAATCVANHLHALGYEVHFETHDTCAEILRYCPTLRVCAGSSCRKMDVNLDGAYESDPQRQTKHFSEMFIAKANSQLAGRGIILQPLNTAPHLRVSQSECNRFMFKHRKWPRPWVMVVPRSNSFTVRSVPDKTWQIACANMKATCFWLGNHGPAPDGIVDIKTTSIKDSMLAIGCADLVVGVDTGPIHVALAIGKPAIVIGQSSDPELHFSSQTDFRAIYSQI